MRREDPDPRGIPGGGRGKNEGRLREVGFSCDGLHPRRRKAVRLENDRQRIAGQRALGEDIDPAEAVAAIRAHRITFD